MKIIIGISILCGLLALTFAAYCLGDITANEKNIEKERSKQ